MPQSAFTVQPLQDIDPGSWGRDEDRRTMDIVLHAGAHCTDEDRLVKCLLKNKDLFLQRGVAGPGPSR